MRQLVVIFIILQITSCRTSEDTSISISTEPTIDLVFINTDSLNQLNDSTDVLSISNETLVTSLTHVNDTLGFLTDSLEVINGAIEMGESLDAELASVQSAIDSYNSQLSMLMDEKAINDSLISVMQSVRAVINSGRVPVENITIVETGNQLVFTDSLSLYTIPLSFDKSFTQYSLTIDGMVYGFQVDYEITQELDAKRNVLLKASDISIVNHTFNSFDTCEICTNGNSTFTFHF